MIAFLRTRQEARKFPVDYEYSAVWYVNPTGSHGDSFWIIPGSYVED